ncbi:MAG: hypothetical protein ACR2HF_15040, partial [Methylococcaceae bacterium]
MFSLHGVKVEETATTIVISNIPVRVITNDIQRIFETSRINTHLFIQVSGRKIVLHRFYALELHHILTALLTSRRIGTQVRVIREILTDLEQNTWLKDRDAVMPDRLDFKLMKNLKWLPCSFQQTFFDIYNTTVSRYHLNGLLLAGAPGSCKTFMTLALAECLN